MQTAYMAPSLSFNTQLSAVHLNSHFTVKSLCLETSPEGLACIKYSSNVAAIYVCIEIGL